MGRKNRYKIAKMVHSDYVILIKSKDGYVTYDNDNLICNYIDFYDKKVRNRFWLFTKFRINYLVLDELDIIDLKKFKDNNYVKYVYITNLKMVVNKLNRQLVGKI